MLPGNASQLLEHAISTRNGAAGVAPFFAASQLLEAQVQTGKYCLKRKPVLHTKTWMRNHARFAIAGAFPQVGLVEKANRA